MQILSLLCLRVYLLITILKAMIKYMHMNMDIQYKARFSAYYTR